MTNSIMSDFEMEVAGEIMRFVFVMQDKFTSIEDITTKEMVNTYWEEYFNSCEMKTPETGLEMPHEEDYYSDNYLDQLYHTGEC